MSDEESPSYYDYVALPDRRPLRFPDGARLALMITINLEYWEKSRPGQKEPLFTGGPMTIPHALPGDVWDTANWTWREYGQRVGIWRLVDMFDNAGVKPSCTVNGMMMVERRRIVDAVNERGWELVAHNWAQTDLLSDHAARPDAERAGVDARLDREPRPGNQPAVVVRLVVVEVHAVAVYRLPQAVAGPMDELVPVPGFFDDGAARTVDLEPAEVAPGAGGRLHESDGRVTAVPGRCESPGVFVGHRGTGESHPGDVSKDRTGFIQFAPEIEQKYLVGTNGPVNFL